ncbi:tellurium resistance protein TerY [Spirochaetia bacterium]|nr:tellurium resistance protein TerY [Spirochaetia bacterium]
MSDYSDVGPGVRRQMVLFFLIDTSGSMAGENIAAVNNAMRAVLPELKKIGDMEDNADSEIEVAVLEFSNGCKWQTPRPIPVETFQAWTNLTAEGGTDLGEACKILASEMKRGRFLRDHNLFAPVIILMSDGQPTDAFEAGLAELQKNEFYNGLKKDGTTAKKSIKVACAIGKDADVNALAKFTGSTESVLQVFTPEALIKWIQFVAIKTSVTNLGDGGQEEINAELKTLEADPDISGTSTSGSDWED